MMGRALMTSETRWGPPRTADGYRVVFQEHHPRLVRFAYLLTSDRHAADDLAADAFAKVFPHWCRGTVDDPGAYLRRTVVNLVRERARRSLVRDIRPVAEPDPGAVDGSEGRTDDQERLLVALRGLSEEQRLVIVLRIWDDRSEAETAELLGVAIGTVKSRTARALDRLRTLLEEADRD